MTKVNCLLLNSYVRKQTVFEVSKFGIYYEVNSDWVVL